jgi:hypothetical protein
MKLRHAAALALVGWYLLGPPQRGESANFDTDAPLSKWKVINSFDNLGACEQGRIIEQGRWYDRAARDTPGTKDAIKDAIMLILLDSAKCVASDDPRLKSN